MKKFLRFSLVALFAVLGMSNAMATDTFTFTQGIFSNGLTVKVNDVEWTLDPTWKSESAFNYDATKGVQIGTAKKPATSFTISTTGISKKIQSVVVNCSGANGIAGTVNVTVGGTAFGSEYTLTSTATDAQFTGSSAVSGKIEVTFAQTSEKGMYLKSITLYYEDDAVKSPAGIAWSKATASVTYGNADNTYQYLPTFQNPNNLTGITFSSDNSDAVSISTDGEIEVEGVGEATLTASFAGNDQYEADEVTCKVTVKEAEPVDPEIETVNTFPYEEAFSNSLGKFYIKDVTLPEGLTYIWAKNNSYVKASAYKSGNYASESWLISPYIDLTSTTTPAFTFNHALNKFNSVDEMKEQATLWIKEKDGDWTQLSGMNYTENSNWTFISAGEFDLSSYKGKTIQIGFKYVSTTTSAGTWEIKEFALTDGEEDPNVKGGENNPYTVEEIMAFDPDNAESLPATKVWVKGYIAGCVNTEKGNELSTGDAVASNLALSSTGVVTSVIPVQLPTGAVRTALNVADNAGNVGKEVLVYGNIQKYCGVAGVKNTSDYKFTGNSTEIDTGIQNLTIDTNANAPMYNLKGERVDANYRGVVIKGGKKTIQK